MLRYLLTFTSYDTLSTFSSPSSPVPSGSSAESSDPVFSDVDTGSSLFPLSSSPSAKTERTEYELRVLIIRAIIKSIESLFVVFILYPPSVYSLYEISITMFEMKLKIFISSPENRIPMNIITAIPTTVATEVTMLLKSV